MARTKHSRQHKAPPSGRRGRSRGNDSASSSPGVDEAICIYDAVDYDPQVCPRLAWVYAQTWEGRTWTGMAKLFGKSRRTLLDWRKAHPEFEAAFKEGRQIGDDHRNSNQVERSLLDVCLGYEYDEIQTKTVTVSNGKRGDERVEIPAVQTTKTRKRIHPNAVAIFFWLTNRLPDRWKHQKELTTAHTGDVHHHHHNDDHDLGKLSKAEVRALRDLVAKSATDSGGSRGMAGGDGSQGIHDSALALRRN